MFELPSNDFTGLSRSLSGSILWTSDDVMYTTVTEMTYKSSPSVDSKLSTCTIVVRVPLYVPTMTINIGNFGLASHNFYNSQT